MFRKIINYIIVTLITLILLFLVSPKNVKGKTADGVSFKTGETLIISETYQDDLYIIGGTINFEGDVKGDLLVVGNIINIKGSITGNLRVLGGTLTVDGVVGKNTSLVTINTVFGSESEILGNVTGYCGMAEMGGFIKKNVKLRVSILKLGGEIQGDTELTGINSLNINDNFKSLNNVYYQSNNEATIEDGATINGAVTRSSPPKKSSGLLSKVFFGERDPSGVFGKLYNIFSTFIVGFFLIYFFSIQAVSLTQILMAKPFKSALLGFLCLLLIPILCILLALTILALPLSVLILILYILALYFTKIITSLYLCLYLGQKTHKIKKYSLKLLIKSLLLGLIIYEVIAAIPIIGHIFIPLSFILGLGSFTIYLVARIQTNLC